MAIHAPIARRESGEAPIDGRLAEWESAGLLTHDQVEAIAGFEHARPVSATRRYGRLVAAISVFGALLVGVGVILSVGANWTGIPDPVKLAMLVLAVGGLEIGGWWLRSDDRYPRTGGALALAGYLLYGAGIHLVAQTYHRPLDDPSLLLLWFLPGLPLAHVLRSRALVVAAVGVGLGALTMSLAGWYDNVDVGVPAVAAPYLAAAGALLGIGAVMERFDRRGDSLGPAYRFAGSAIGLALLYAGGFFHVFYDDWTGGTVPTPAAVWIGLSAAVAIGAVVWLARELAGGVRLGLVADAGALLAGVLFAAWWAFGPVVSTVLAASAANAALLAAVVWLVALGLLERREALVNLAVVVFGVALLTRYFEIGAGMLGTGLGFIGTGLVLVGLGFGLERARRTLLTRMDDEEAADAR